MTADNAPIVIAPEGEVDLYHSTRLKEQLDPVIADRRPRVVIDLSAVTYVDSSGLAVFIETLQRIQSYDGFLALCGLRDNIRQIFAVARLDQVFRIFPDQATALSS
jgi:anti-sigma B factor antagonist